MHDLEEHPAPGAVQLEARSQQQHQGDGGEPQVVLAKSSDAGSTSSGDLGKTMSKAWNKFKDTMSKDTMPPSMRKGEWKGDWGSEQHCVCACLCTRGSAARGIQSKLACMQSLTV